MHYIAEKHLLGRRMENSSHTHWLDNYIVKCNKICADSSRVPWHTGASPPSAATGSPSWIISHGVSVPGEKGWAGKLFFLYVCCSAHTAPALRSYSKPN